LASCVANGNAYGGFGNSCNGWNLASCVANGNANGGFGSGCNGWNLASCVNSDSEQLFNTCYAIYYDGVDSPKDTCYQYAPNYQPISRIGAYWNYYGGIVTNSNNTLLFTNTITGQKLAAFCNLSLRPYATRTVNVTMWITNNVTYSVALNTGYMPYPSWGFVSVPGTTGQQTNVVVSVSNTNNYPVAATLWIQATAQTLTTGYAAYSLGCDSIMQTY
jgi:hypothetical protein